jgi:hypothetical protein
MANGVETILVTKSKAKPADLEAGSLVLIASR